MLRHWLGFVILAFVVAVGAPVYGEQLADKAEPAATAPASKDVKVSLNVDEMSAGDALDVLRKASGQKLLMESTVKGNVTFAVSSVPLDTALTAMCSAGNLEWRKIYLSPDSKLLETPDKLASTVRLMSGMACPDMLVSDGTRGVGMHCTDKKMVNAAEQKLSADLGMQPVYLITNDSAVAQKSAESKTSAVTAYCDATRKLMDDFAKMTPEEQEQAVVEGILMYETVGPEYMSSVMRAVLKTDPELLGRMSARQSEVLLYMDQEDRRQMIRMNMEMQKSMSPELMQMLQEDMKAIMEEQKANSGQ